MEEANRKGKKRCCDGIPQAGREGGRLSGFSPHPPANGHEMGKLRPEVTKLCQGFLLSVGEVVGGHQASYQLCLWVLLVPQTGKQACRRPGVSAGTPTPIFLSPSSSCHGPAGPHPQPDAERGYVGLPGAEVFSSPISYRQDSNCHYPSSKGPNS